MNNPRPLPPARPVPASHAEGRTRIPKGLFCKCENEACGEILDSKSLERNFFCCPKCDHHFRLGARQRLDQILDPGSWHELDSTLETTDPLQFQGRRSYRERLEEAREKTGLRDAILCGLGSLEGRPVVIGAMDFRFMGGSMGSVVGEKVARAAEAAVARRRPLILVCCSGGARMDEGVFSLLQMAKTAAALQRHHAAGLPSLAVLTDPTLAGVSASFAFLPDVLLAEPRAMIGFTGARVIEQTLKMKLPPGFQEAEFLLKHGQIDMVVPRRELRATLARLLDYLQPREEPPPPAGADLKAAPEPRRRVRPDARTRRGRRGGKQRG